MRRFFRSRRVPDPVVLVLAFFASRVISQGEPEDVPTFNEFTERVDSEPESIETVIFEQKQNKLKYTLTDGTEYETGYLAEQEDTLINTLEREGDRDERSIRSRAAASSARSPTSFRSCSSWASGSSS